MRRFPPFDAQCTPLAAREPKSTSLGWGQPTGAWRRSNPTQIADRPQLVIVFRTAGEAEAAHDAIKATLANAVEAASPSRDPERGLAGWVWKAYYEFYVRLAVGRKAG